MFNSFKRGSVVGYSNDAIKNTKKFVELVLDKKNISVIDELVKLATLYGDGGRGEENDLQRTMIILSVTELGSDKLVKELKELVKINNELVEVILSLPRKKKDEKKTEEKKIINMPTSLKDISDNMKVRLLFESALNQYISNLNNVFPSRDQKGEDFIKELTMVSKVVKGLKCLDYYLGKEQTEILEMSDKQKPSNK